ncbi:MAG: EAL domain-containing protein, partial [Coleofasciculaceae cyanobacterium]
DTFLAVAHQLFAQADAKGDNIFELQDGRIIERYSQPQWLGETIVGRVCSFRDITVRHRSQLALRKSEATNKALLNAIPDLMIRMSRDGTYLNFIPAKNFDRILPCSQMEGKNIYEVMPLEIAQQRMHYVEQALKTGKTQSYEFPLNWDDNHLSIEEARIVVSGDDEVLVIIRDITERKQMEEALRASEECYRRIIETTSEGVWIIDAENHTVFANQTMAEMLGYGVDEMLGMSLLSFVSEEWKSLAVAAMSHIQPGVQKVRESFDFQLRCKDGSTLWALVAANPIFDRTGQYNGALGMFTDITQRKISEEKIHYQAMYDLLTDLPNRTLFNEQLSGLIQAESKQKLALLFLDLDRFKTINDTLGHAVGDRFLQAVAQRLSHLQNGIIARWGGDEFTVILPQASNTEATAVAETILSALKPAFNLEGHQLHISASIGIALYPGDGEDAETLVINADAALYRAKQKGRNNYQFYTAAMNSQASELLLLENDLHRALKNQEFEVYYQPQVNITTQKVTGMEALVRWRHPQFGLISPGKFIPLAEETGLIIPLDQWVLQTACAQNKVWQDAGLPPLRMSVNLSTRQFQQPTLLDVVADVLQKTGLAAEYLELEITETIAMQDVELSIEILDNLHSMGVHLSMDDFGTGYSSLGYLKQFPLNTLKIDKSFIEDVASVQTASII